MINLSSLLGGGMLLKQQIITADGNFVRPAKMAGNTVWLTMIGGGSSGVAQTGQAGIGGQYLIRFPVDIGTATSIACVIGLGGAQTTATTGAHNPGGTTSFGSLISVIGGNAVTGQGGATGGSSVASSIRSGRSTPLGSGGIVVTSQQASGGGGGLVVDASNVQGGTVAAVTSAKGYGAGGTSFGIGYAGASGVILVEWPEFV